MFRSVVMVLVAGLLGGCTGLAKYGCTDPPGMKLKPDTLVTGQTPAGVVGISVPDTYYQSANSFPPGAAHADGHCL